MRATIVLRETGCGLHRDSEEDLGVVPSNNMFYWVPEALKNITTRCGQVLKAFVNLFFRGKLRCGPSHYWLHCYESFVHVGVQGFQ